MTRIFFISMAVMGLFIALPSRAAVEFSAETSVASGRPLHALEIGDVVTIDITFRNDGGEVFEVRATATGFDTSVVTFSSGEATEFILADCLAPTGCASGIFNAKFEDIVLDLNNPFGPVIRIISALTLFVGATETGELDLGVDGTLGGGQVRLVFVVTGLGATEIRIGVDPDYGGFVHSEPQPTEVTNTSLFLQTASEFGPGDLISQSKISDGEVGQGATLDNGDGFGSAVAAIGDLDGDGIDDLAVGAFRDDDGGSNRGAIWILFMNADGTVRTEQKISQTAGGFPFTLSGNFGTSATSLGDLDGDGVVDLAVGAPNDDLDGTDRGAVWILFLNTNGTVRNTSRISDSTGGFSGSLDNGDFFGMAVAAIGDVDGDGVMDLAVGATGDDEMDVDGGTVWILFLTPSGQVRDQRKMVTANGLDVDVERDDRFGVAIVGLGDINGDGVPDLAVAADRAVDEASGTDSGAVYVIRLGATGSVSGHVTLSGFASDGDLFGFGLGAPGDLDGDGAPELVVGAIFDDDGGTNRGAAWIFSVVQSGNQINLVRKLSDASLDFSHALDDGDRFGASIAGYRSFDGTGGGGILVGTPRDDDGGTDRGGVHVFGLEGAGAICGNGVLDPVEECDDGNASDLDGCTQTCFIVPEPGFVLSLGLGLLANGFWVRRRLS